MQARDAQSRGVLEADPGPLNPAEGAHHALVPPSDVHGGVLTSFTGRVFLLGLSHPLSLSMCPLDAFLLMKSFRTTLEAEADVCRRMKAALVY